MIKIVSSFAINKCPLWIILLSLGEDGLDRFLQYLSGYLAPLSNRWFIGLHHKDMSRMIFIMKDVKMFLARHSTCYYIRFTE